MSKEPLVSILIPTYNREKFIGEAVECAVNQTYKNLEIIVVDNCSTDNSCDILKKFSDKDKRIKVYRNEKNLGPTLNWQECLKHANGEYIKIIWSDDIVDKKFVSKAVKILIDNEDISFVYTKMKIFGEKIKEKIFFELDKTKVVSSEFFVSKLLEIDSRVPVSGTCAMFRKKNFKIYTDIKSVRGVNYNLTGAGADALMFLHALEGYNKCYYIDEVLSFCRNHPTSITVQTDWCELALEYLESFLYYFNTNKDSNFKKYMKSVKKLYVNESVKTLLSSIREETELDNEELIDTFFYAFFQNPKEKLEKIFSGCKGKKVGIYGASNHTRNMLSLYKNIFGGFDFDIYIFDSSTSKHGKNFMDYVVMPPEKINQLQLDKVIISSETYEDEIFDYLKKFVNSNIEIVPIYKNKKYDVKNLFIF